MTVYPSTLDYKNWDTFWQLLAYFAMIFAGIFIAYYIKLWMNKSKGPKKQKNVRKKPKKSLSSVLGRNLKINI